MMTNQGLRLRLAGRARIQRGEWRSLSTGISIQPGGDILIGTKLLKELGKTFVLDCGRGMVEVTDSAGKLDWEEKRK